MGHICRGAIDEYHLLESDGRALQATVSGRLDLVWLHVSVYELFSVYMQGLERC